MTNKIKTILSKELSVDINSISDDFSQTNNENWDSLKHLMIITALEKAFDISIEPEEIIELDCYLNIKKLVNLKKSNLEKL